MVVKIFQHSPSKEAALQRLRAATILQWSSLSAAVQQMIVQQAIALSDDMVEVHREIEKLTQGSAVETAAGPSSEDPTGPREG
jgi:hypothetical protein